MEESTVDSSLAWLLEEKSPGVRFLALRDIAGLPDGDPELERARSAAYAQGPIARILERQDEEGWWEQSGPAYGPKYRSTPWAIMLLAQLGARAQDDERIAKGCRYLVDQTFADGGYFGLSGRSISTLDCFQGNLCWSLTDLDFSDPRMDAAFDWMARSVTGEDVASYDELDALWKYQGNKQGPLFRCGINYGLSCGWGGIKVMEAFASLPKERRTPVIQRAIEAGAEYMLANDPANVGYPSGGGIMSKWWFSFGFPLYYVADILQNVSSLVRLGYGGDPRLQPALALIRSKADDAGRWSLDRDYGSRTHMSFGVPGKPNKWVTYRALRVLRVVGAVDYAM
jgi:hypothetical protein